MIADEDDAMQMVNAAFPYDTVNPLFSGQKCTVDDLPPAMYGIVIRMAKTSHVYPDE